MLLHLTCHLPKDDLKRVLANAREAGIRNILALRGDPAIGQARWKPVKGGFRYVYREETERRQRKAAVELRK